MVPPESFFHGEKSRLLQIPHTPPHCAFGHFEFPCHRGNGRPTESLLVGPATQVEVHSDGPVGQVALVELLKVCHLPAPSLFPGFYRRLAVWR